MRLGREDEVTVRWLEEDGVHEKLTSKANVKVEEVNSCSKLELNTNIGVLAVEVVHEAVQLVFAVLPQTENVVLETSPEAHGEREGRVGLLFPSA